MNFIQSTLQVVEVGKAQVLVRIIPLLTTLLVVIGAYNFIVYHGLSDAQSMDNAQLARQIAREFCRTPIMRRVIPVFWRRGST
jgi:hypothetical protein